MKKASISKVKAELSHFIKMVKRGEDVIILDRDRPVAMLTAIQDDHDFVVQEPLGDRKAFFKALKTRVLDERPTYLTC